MRESSPVPPDISWDLLDRYYTGEATPEECQTVRTYLAAHPERQRVLDHLVMAVRRLPTEKRTANVPAMLAAAHERITPAGTLKRIVHTLFDGSIERAVAALLALDDTRLSELDIAQLRQLIEQAKQEGR